MCAENCGTRQTSTTKKNRDAPSHLKPNKFFFPGWWSCDPPHSASDWLPLAACVGWVQAVMVSQSEAEQGSHVITVFPDLKLLSELLSCSGGSSAVRGPSEGRTRTEGGRSSPAPGYLGNTTDTETRLKRAVWRFSHDPAEFTADVPHMSYQWLKITSNQSTSYNWQQNVINTWAWRHDISMFTDVISPHQTRSHRHTGSIIQILYCILDFLKLKYYQLHVFMYSSSVKSFMFLDLLPDPDPSQSNQTLFNILLLFHSGSHDRTDGFWLKHFSQIFSCKLVFISPLHIYLTAKMTFIVEEIGVERTGQALINLVFTGTVVVWWIISMPNWKQPITN